MMNYCLLILLSLIFYIPAQLVANEFLEHHLIGYYDRLDTIQENEVTLRNNNEQNRSDHDFVIISLGYNCDPAIYTKKFNIRTFAFPFDWCITPFQAVYNFINSDFKDFFKLERLITSTYKNFTPQMIKFLTKNNLLSFSESYVCVLDKGSGMIFNHDFINNHPRIIQACYDEPNSKYQRRVARYLSQINSNKYIYFIRYNDISKNKSIKLLQLLESKFSKGNFTLIVVNNKPEFNENWNVPRIKSYCTLYSNWEKICADIKSGNLKTVEY